MARQLNIFQFTAYASRGFWTFMFALMLAGNILSALEKLSAIRSRIGPWCWASSVPAWYESGGICPCRGVWWPVTCQAPGKAFCINSIQWALVNLLEWLSIFLSLIFNIAHISYRYVWLISSWFTSWVGCCLNQWCCYFHLQDCMLFSNFLRWCCHNSE